MVVPVIPTNEIHKILYKIVENGEYQKLINTYQKARHLSTYDQELIFNDRFSNEKLYIYSLTIKSSIKIDKSLLKGYACLAYRFNSVKLKSKKFIESNKGKPQYNFSCIFASRKKFKDSELKKVGYYSNLKLESSFHTIEEKYLQLCNKSYHASAVRSLFTCWHIASPNYINRNKIETVEEEFFDNEQSVIKTIFSLEEKKLVKYLKSLSTNIMDFTLNGYEKIKNDLNVLGFSKTLQNHVKFSRRELFVDEPRNQRVNAGLYFFYSINMLKRGLAPLPMEMVGDAVEDTFKVLTDEPDRMVSVGATRAINLAVDLIIKKAKLNHRDLTKSFEDGCCPPGFQSTYEYTKGDGGSKNVIFDNNIKNDEDYIEFLKRIIKNYEIPEEDDLNVCRIAALIEPNKVRPITIQHSRYQVGGNIMKRMLIDTWKKTDLGTMSETEYLEKIGRFQTESVKSSSKDGKYEVNENGDEVKISLNRRIKRRMQKFWHSVDYDAATNYMNPAASKICLERFMMHFRRILPILPFEFDWQNFWDFNLQCIDMRYITLDKAVAINGKNVIQLLNLWDKAGMQTNGQLMGNPLSFTLLCAINLSTVLRAKYRHLIDIDENLDNVKFVFVPGSQYKYFESNIRDSIFADFTSNEKIDNNEEFEFIITAKKSLKLYFPELPSLEDFLQDVIINGDDAVFSSLIGNDFQNIHTECARDVGLRINFLKTWVSKYVFSLNSILFYFNFETNEFGKEHIEAEPVGYLNQAMLYNNNIKNIEGINEKNLSNCTELVYRYGPKNYRRTNLLDNLTTYYDKFDYCDGDLCLAFDFFNFYASINSLNKNRCSLPYNEISSGGLGFKIAFPFLNQSDTFNSSMTIVDKKFVGSCSLTAEPFAQFINGKVADILGFLVDYGQLVPVIDFENCHVNNIERGDLELEIQAFLLNSLDYKWRYFSQEAPGNINFSYRKIKNVSKFRILPISPKHPSSNEFELEQINEFLVLINGITERCGRF